MALTDMKAMLRHAYEHGYAVGGFDVVDLSFVSGVIKAAERCQAPVILSLAESHFVHYDFETLMPAVEEAARNSAVPCAIHLDHGTSLESAIQSIRLGCNGVMVDTSEEPLEMNINLTMQVVQAAHGCGIPVEGELGYVPGVEGEDAELHPGDIAFTEVETAVDYVARTDVDMLAVSIGTVHGRMQGTPKLDFERLQAINTELGLPLVIHGGTGLDEDQYLGLINRGVSKINYYTALADAAASAVWGQNKAPSYAHLFSRVRDAVADETERCIRLWGGENKAAELLSRCPPWEPVEHLVVYNVEHERTIDVTSMIDEGRRVLAEVPGVRAVETGEAVMVDKARYRYCWLVRFASQTVIDSYRDHPLHIEFADGRFRPLAADRMSIDYRIFSGDLHA